MKFYALLVLTSCGRVDFDIDSEATAPRECSSFVRPEVDPSDLDVVLAVAPTPGGVVTVWAPHAVGDLEGAIVDLQGTLVVPPRIVKAGAWTSTSATFLDGKLVVGEVEDGGAVKVDLVSTDLSSLLQSDLLCPTATSLGTLAAVHAGPDTVTFIGSAVDVSVTPYDASWNPTTSQIAIATTMPSSIATTSAGSDAIAAWSTSQECVMVRVIDQANGTARRSPVRCDAPQVAWTGSTIALAYEDARGIELSVGEFETVGPGTATLIAPGGSSPRLVHDGERLWLAYRDATQHVHVGHVHGARLFETATGTTSATEAFQLAVIDGGVWLFAVQATGLGATQYCLP